MRREYLMFGWLVMLAPAAQAQPVDGAVVTYERVLVTAAGDVRGLETGTHYLTPKTDGRYRRDVERTTGGAPEHLSEIVVGDQRITVNHTMKIALWGPRSVWWEAPSLRPMVILPRSSPPAPATEGPDAGGGRGGDAGGGHGGHGSDAGGGHGGDAHEPRGAVRTDEVRTIGPLLLRAWVQEEPDGMRIVSWLDEQSQQSVADEFRSPDGGWSGTRVTSAARKSLPADTFAIPAGYDARPVR